MMVIRETKDFFALSCKVYNDLVDAQSRAIFTARMSYNLTNDRQYLYDLIDLLPQFERSRYEELRSLVKELNQLLEKPSARLIMYGAGNHSKYLVETLDEYEWYAFCDQDARKQHDVSLKLPVISPEQLLSDHKEDYVVIGSLKYYDEIYNELKERGFPIDHIVNKGLEFVAGLDHQYYESSLVLDANQYFEAPIMEPRPKEVFVDAGCFNCDTSLAFQRWCGNDYDKIYAFEPDPANYENCRSIIADTPIDRIELLHAGVWSQDDTLQFNSESNSASSFSDNGSISIAVRSIDSVLNGGRVTFIKLDVEGSELEALKGAERSIVKYRPRIAVCIYHKPEDMLDIQLYLQSLVPDYQFYIRHYSNTMIETVLYAV